MTKVIHETTHEVLTPTRGQLGRIAIFAGGLAALLFVLAKSFTNSTGLLGALGAVAWVGFYIGVVALIGLGILWVIRGRRVSRTPKRQRQADRRS